MCVCVCEIKRGRRSHSYAPDNSFQAHNASTRSPGKPRQNRFHADSQQLERGFSKASTRLLLLKTGRREPHISNTTPCVNVLLLPDFQQVIRLITEADNTTKAQGCEIKKFYFHPPGHSSP